MDPKINWTNKTWDVVTGCDRIEELDGAAGIRGNDAVAYTRQQSGEPLSAAPDLGGPTAAGDEQQQYQRDRSS